MRLFKTRYMGNPLKDSICFRIEMNAQKLLNLLESVSKANNSFERCASKLFSVIENKKIQYEELKSYIHIFNEILSSDDKQPTPYELYKSNFIKFLEILFKVISYFMKLILIKIFRNLIQTFNMIYC